MESGKQKRKPIVKLGLKVRRIVNRIVTRQSMVGDTLPRLVRWSPFIQEARTNLREWERRYADSEAGEKARA